MSVRERPAETYRMLRLRHPGHCDEVLAARLALGLRRLEWLGATLERLIRRRQLGRTRLGASAVKIHEA